MNRRRKLSNQKANNKIHPAYSEMFWLRTKKEFTKDLSLLTKCFDPKYISISCFISISCTFVNFSLLYPSQFFDLISVSYWLSFLRIPEFRLTFCVKNISFSVKEGLGVPCYIVIFIEAIRIPLNQIKHFIDRPKLNSRWGTAYVVRFCVSN